jgi:hypothetical protein
MLETLDFYAWLHSPARFAIRIGVIEQDPEQLSARNAELAWIATHSYLLWPAASEAFTEVGRGAIVFDKTEPQKATNLAFGYLPQSIFEAGNNEEVKRQLREYNPEEEFVVVMLKPSRTMNSYVVRPGRAESSTT